MQGDVIVPEVRPLSQVERVVDTFVAPSKTFTDILRSASWWLPFVLFLVFGIANSFAIQKKIGWNAVAQRQIELNPKQQEKMEQLSPEQRNMQMKISTIATEGIAYGFSVVLVIGCLFFALLYWATLNFALGAQTRYWQVFAVVLYSLLPRLLLTVLNIIFVFAGVNTENYDIRNPVGVNLAYYMPDAAPALKPWLTAIDLFGIWSIILLIIGFAIIARKSKGQTAAVVIGWNLLFLLIGSGFAAAFG